MLTLSNQTAQTVQAGQTVTLNTVLAHTGCGECYRNGTSSVKLRQGGIYEVIFSANVASATANAPVQVAIALGGVAMADTTAISTPSAANAFNHISTPKYVVNCCEDFDRITVVNNGTNPITIGANPSLIVARRA